MCVCIYVLTAIQVCKSTSVSPEGCGLKQKLFPKIYLFILIYLGRCIIKIFLVASELSREEKQRTGQWRSDLHPVLPCFLIVFQLISTDWSGNKKYWQVQIFTWIKNSNCLTLLPGWQWTDANACYCKCWHTVELRMVLQAFWTWHMVLPSLVQCSSCTRSCKVWRLFRSLYIVFRWADGKGWAPLSASRICIICQHVELVFGFAVSDDSTQDVHQPHSSQIIFPCLALAVPLLMNPAGLGSG